MLELTYADFYRSHSVSMQACDFLELESDTYFCNDIK